MILSELQTELLRRLRSAAAYRVDRTITYRSEWLGYLPYGAYHWITIGKSDVTPGLPRNWQLSDLRVLEAAGVLRKVHEWQNPDEEHELTVSYELSES